jgi:hypothetical protein
MDGSDTGCLPACLFAKEWTGLPAPMDGKGRLDVTNDAAAAGGCYDGDWVHGIILFGPAMAGRWHTTTTTTTIITDVAATTITITTIT